MDGKTYTLYFHVTPDGLAYVGTTSQPVAERWRNGNGYRNNPRFWEAIQRFGWDNIKHIIAVEGIENAKAAAVLEALLIAYLRTNDPQRGYNATITGRGFYGGKHTAETRQRMREKRKAATRRNCYIVREDASGCVCYDSPAEAARDTGADRSNILKACRGERNRAGGFSWYAIPRD